MTYDAIDNLIDISRMQRAAVTRVAARNNVLPHPTLTPVHITHLDGRPWAKARFVPGDASAPWAWVAREVARECDCLESDVGCAEGPDGEDWITVEGIPVYLCLIGNLAGNAAAASFRADLS
jgi:hypothetical protein